MYRVIQKSVCICKNNSCWKWEVPLCIHALGGTCDVCYMTIWCWPLLSFNQLSHGLWALWTCMYSYRCTWTFESSCIRGGEKVSLQGVSWSDSVSLQYEIEVLTVAIMKMAVFWVLAQCCLVEVYWCFRGACCLRCQGNDDYMAQQPTRLPFHTRHSENLISHPDTSEHQISWSPDILL
jgi:hypothetical protein